MKKLKIGKITGFAILALVLILLLWIAYIFFILPSIPVPSLKVEQTQERVERGKYLANHVLVCIDCHSVRDWTKFAGPIELGTEGKGGERFDQTMGFPGIFYSANITPFHLHDWSDGEIYRAITSGVGKKNRPLFPVMPYLNYGQLDNEDIYSVIAYIRSLPAIDFQPPASKADFPMNIILHTIPQKPDPKPIPAKTDSLDYGKYLVTASACIDCHTQFEKGKMIMEKAFAGGREFNLPWGILRSANITPDRETGIGNMTKEAFVNRFKAYDLAAYTPASVNKNDFNSLMPWTMYGGMEAGDIEAIYIYLNSLQPVNNLVVKFTPVK